MTQRVMGSGMTLSAREMGDRDSDPPAQENSLGGRATGNHRRQRPCLDDDGTRSRGAINRDPDGRRSIERLSPWTAGPFTPINRQGQELFSDTGLEVDHD